MIKYNKENRELTITLPTKKQVFIGVGILITGLIIGLFV